MFIFSNISSEIVDMLVSEDDNGNLVSDVSIADFVVSQGINELESIDQQLLLEEFQQSSSTPTLVPSMENNEGNCSSAVENTQPSYNETCHSQPDWLHSLKKDFHTQIIEMCSVKTKSAVNANLLIENTREHGEVKDEILNTVTNKLKSLFSLGNLPGSKTMREIAHCLSHTYPAMFCDTGSITGPLKPDSLDVIAFKLKERLRGQLRQALKRDKGYVQDNATVPSKKGKKKVIYGIDADVWYSSKKATPDIAARLRETNSEDNFDARESVFSAYRGELVHEFKSGKGIASICKGFWKSPEHLASLFSHMTRDTPPLTKNVHDNFTNQMKYLELVLKDQIKTVDFFELMEEVENTCLLENQGSTTLKDIHLMVVYLIFYQLFFFL